MFPVDSVVRMENNKINVHPLLVIMFKNTLRTFEAEIFKIFKVTVHFERCFRSMKHISVIS